MYLCVEALFCIERMRVITLLASLICKHLSRRAATKKRKEKVVLRFVC